jgi:hypothetical protein
VLDVFAELGSDLFRKLFSDKELYDSWLSIREKSIERVKLGDPMRLHVQPVDNKNWLLIPFALIYDDPSYKSGDPVDPTNFWGYRFQIYINVGKTYELSKPLAKPIRVAAAMADPEETPVAPVVKEVMGTPFSDAC